MIFKYDNGCKRCGVKIIPITIIATFFLAWVFIGTANCERKIVREERSYYDKGTFVDKEVIRYDNNNRIVSRNIVRKNQGLPFLFAFLFIGVMVASTAFIRTVYMRTRPKKPYGGFTAEDLENLRKASEWCKEKAKKMKSESATSPCEILGVSQNATNNEIKAAYRKKMLEYHPDRTAGLGVEIRKKAEEMTKIINKAYEELLQDRGIG